MQLQFQAWAQPCSNSNECDTMVNLSYLPNWLTWNSFFFLSHSSAFRIWIWCRHKADLMWQFSVGVLGSSQKGKNGSLDSEIQQTLAFKTFSKATYHKYNKYAQKLWKVVWLTEATAVSAVHFFLAMEQCDFRSISDNYIPVYGFKIQFQFQNYLGKLPQLTTLFLILFGYPL